MFPLTCPKCLVSISNCSTHCTFSNSAENGRAGASKCVRCSNLSHSSVQNKETPLLILLLLSFLDSTGEKAAASGKGGIVYLRAEFLLIARVCLQASPKANQFDLTAQLWSGCPVERAPGRVNSIRPGLWEQNIPL